MSLTINAPVVEYKLRSEAAKHGVTAEEYAETIVASHLTFDAFFEQCLPFYVSATNEEWKGKFDS